MIVGLAFDLKGEVKANQGQRSAAPEDALEEYDSPETVEGLGAAIESLGHTVVRLGGGRTFLKNVVETKVDFVFNIAEGLGSYRSREAQVPGILEMLDIPYSGSDPQCLSICLDKVLTKRLVASAGVPTPEWAAIGSMREFNNTDWSKFPFPAFVKPAYEGSSKGVRSRSRVENRHQLSEVVDLVLGGYGQVAMVEQFIAGEEITVGVIGNSPSTVLGVMRVVPRKKDPNFVYSLEIKRDWENLVDYECPAKLSGSTLQLIVEHSLKAFRSLECRDFGRIDFRVSPSGQPYFLEMNPLAGLNPKSSDLSIMGRLQGWTYERLIGAILGAALLRYPH
ncbi:MAG: ATP-grasp domain-containing protein [Chloroflexi bacterium]|nr:ATP-grasp domain-containing protein [Chloroflexota bacterium]